MKTGDEVGRWFGVALKSFAVVVVVACGTGAQGGGESPATLSLANTNPVGSPIPLDARRLAVTANVGTVVVNSGAKVDSYTSSAGAYGGANVGQRGSVRAGGAISGSGAIAGNLVPESPAGLAVVPVPANARKLPLGASVPGNVNINTGTFTLAPGSYVVNNLNVNYPGAIRIHPAGAVKIWVTGTLNLGGNENLNGAPSDLTFLVGSAGFVNVNANGKLFGNLYAPLAVVNLNSKVFGTVVGSSVKLNSGSEVHYDTLMGVDCSMDSECDDAEPCTLDSCDPAVGCTHSADPACQNCPIGFAPGALAPVFDGARDYGLADGAPSPVRMVFPTIDGEPFQSRILLGCERYPMIILAHGNCFADPKHYKAWYRGGWDAVAVGLARSGYVVAIPFLPETQAGTFPWEPNNGDIQLISQTIDWLRNGWEFRGALLQDSIGIVGHSYGALLGARYAQESIGTEHEVSAYAGLSGVWEEWPGFASRPINSLAIPKLVTWGSGSLDISADLDLGWPAVATPKHGLAFTEGGHFDYLTPAASACAVSDRGPCPHVQSLTREVVLSFFSNYMPPEGWPLRGAFSDPLLLPEIHPTPEQDFYLGLHRVAEDRYITAGASTCTATFRWDAVNTGTYQLPP